MVKKIIIGFGCKRLRGKDTAASLMHSEMTKLGYPDVRMDAFAKTLKDVCKLVFGFTNRQVYVQEEKAKVDPFWGFTPRWALQTVGTEAFRQQIDNDVWVKVLQRRYQQNPESVIVTDVRFPNEVAAIQNMGGFTIRVDRNIPFDEDKDHHPSETALDDFEGWDYVINNNSTLGDLHQQVIEILHGIGV